MAEMAQLRIEELRKLREQIPRFAIPESTDAARRLSHAASVSPVFIELTNVAVTNQTALVRADGTPPAVVRDLMAYADAYVPLADELEAVAQFLRYSTTAARNLAGTEALTTYSLAQRHWSTGSMNAVGIAALNKTGTTQQRVSFNLGDNDDTGNDDPGDSSGENGTYPPSIRQTSRCSCRSSGIVPPERLLTGDRIRKEAS